MLVIAAFCLASANPVVISLSIKNLTELVDADNVDDDAGLQIVKVVAFNNTTPSSIAVDTLRNLVYVSVNPEVLESK